MGDVKIKKIVLTGGPCAGKTEILEDVEEYLTKKGYYVIVIPETATQLIKSKIIPTTGAENVKVFQDIVLQFQCIKEKSAEEYAKKTLSDKDVIILCDRSVMDNRAYFDSIDDFDNLLRKHNLDEQKLIYSYDLVIDLISTATSRKELYQLDGVRNEPVHLAASLDRKTTLAWINHPKLITVKPTDSIEEKSEIVISKINDFLTGNMHNKKQAMHFVRGMDWNIYNDENSKTINVFNTYLDGDLIVSHKKYKDSSIFVLMNCNNSTEQLICEKQFMELLHIKKIVFTEQMKETYFTEDGNVYKIIQDGNREYLILDNSSEKNTNVSPVQSISPQFVKRKD